MSTSRFLPALARAVCPLLVLALGVFALAPRAFAQANSNPPERMTYQGYVVDANGNPLATNAPKNYDFIFRIWADPTSTSTGTTNRLWTEQQTATVDKGYFSVILGEGVNIGEQRNPLSTVFTNQTSSERWIGLTVKGIGAGGTDVNILPRLKLVSSPYAFLATKAMTADGTAITTGTINDGRLSSNVALRSGGNTFSGNQIINNSLGIGVSPSRPLTVNGAGNTGIGLVNTNGTGKPYVITSLDDGRLLIKDDLTGSLQFFMDKGNSTFSLNGGNVGIGTTGPTNKLHVSGGNLQLDSGNQVFFTDNGEIRSSDINHRILFRRSENKIELREYGDLIFSSGATIGAETAKAVLLGNGNLGVGATNPAAKLQVAGSGFFGSDAGALASSVGAGVRLFHEAGIGGQIFAYNYGTSSATNLVLQGPGGNVGIGTNNPQAKLHVGGTLRVDGSIVGTMSMAGAGNFYGSTPYVRLSDQKPKGTGGGTAVAGINVRTFNVEYDPQNIATTNNATNIVLQAGTYQCRIVAPAFRVNNHQARLRNVTASTVLLLGTSEWADNDTGGSGNSSTISGQFTLLSPSTVVVEHYTAAGSSLGSAANATWTDGEVYTVAEFWKLQ